MLYTLQWNVRTDLNEYKTVEASPNPAQENLGKATGISVRRSIIGSFYRAHSAIRHGINLYLNISKGNSGGKINGRCSWKRANFAATSILILSGHINPCESSARRIGENGSIIALTILHVHC